MALADGFLVLPVCLFLHLSHHMLAMDECLKAADWGGGEATPVLGVWPSHPHLQPCRPMGRHIWLQLELRFCSCKLGAQSPEWVEGRVSRWMWEGAV